MATGIATTGGSVVRKVNDVVKLTTTLARNGIAQTGNTVFVRVFRRSDSKWWNFNLSVWQVAQPTGKALTEILPGIYETDFDHSVADPNTEGDYLGIFWANSPFKFFGTVEYVFRNRTVDEVINGTTHFNVDSVGYSLTLIRNRFQVGFAVLDNTTHNAKGHLLTGRWRIFDTKALAEAATDGGTGEGEIATIEVTASTESGDARLTKLYKAIRQ